MSTPPFFVTSLIMGVAVVRKVKLSKLNALVLEVTFVLKRIYTSWRPATGVMSAVRVAQLSVVGALMVAMGLAEGLSRHTSTLPPTALLVILDRVS